MYDIIIHPVSNGLMFRVGCQEFCFPVEEGLAELKRYIENPKMVEREYRRKGIIKEAEPDEENLTFTIPTQGQQDMTATEIRRREAGFNITLRGTPLNQEMNREEAK